MTTHSEQLGVMYTPETQLNKRKAFPRAFNGNEKQGAWDMLL